MEARTTAPNEAPGIRTYLFAAACAAAVGSAWVFPSALEPMAAGLQSILGGAGVLLLLGALWLVPGALRNAPVTWPELSLVLMVILGSGVTLIGVAPLGQLAEALWWIQALALVAVVSRIADRRLLMATLHCYGVLALVASAVFITYRMSGATGKAPFIIHQNHFAFLLILPIMFYLHRLLDRLQASRPVIDALALLVLVPALLLTQSRAVWLAILVAGAVLLLVLVRRVFVKGFTRELGAILLITGLIFVAIVAGDLFSVYRGNDSVFAVITTLQFPDEGSIGGRIRRWLNTRALIEDHWIFGTGLGTWSSAYENYRHVTIADAGGSPSTLNTYLLVFAEAGIVGLGLFVASMVGAARRSVKSGVPLGVMCGGLAWAVALNFHSLYDFKVMLLGFAFVLGVMLWRDPDDASPAPGKSRVIPGMALAAMALVCIGDARYGLAEIERELVYRAARIDIRNDERFLWRLLDPLSPALEFPMTRDGLRANSEGIARANRFQAPDYRDFYLLLGDISHEQGEAKEAIEWYELALARNLRSIQALVNLCRAYRDVGNLEAAYRACQRGARGNPANPDIHRLLASLEAAMGKNDEAIAELEVARSLLRERMGINDFGIRTRGLVSSYYQQIQTLSKDLSELREDVSPSAAQMLAEIVQTPLIHKSITLIGCDLYFSANINARYNLWKFDTCGSNTRIELVTNDSRAPFRLRSAGSGLYFMADERGDSRFTLFQLNTDSDDLMEVPLPPGYLMQYSPSADGRQLAVVMLNGRTFRLHVGDPRTGEYEQVHQSRQPLGEPVWSLNPGPEEQDQEQLLFIEGDSLLRAVESSSEVVSTVLETSAVHLSGFSVSPEGTAIAYTTRSGSKSSGLHLLDKHGESRELLTSSESLIIDPLWRDADTVVFREVEDDEYLLRQIGLRDGRVAPLGPEEGVVYPVLPGVDPRSLVFVAATPEVPASIYRVRDARASAELMLRFDSITADQIIPNRRRVIDPDRDVVVYRYSNGNTGDGAIIWLHGGSDRFSPRWHVYAQYFAVAGFEFLALNYSEPWPRDVGDYAEQAREVAAMVRSLRREGFRRVFLIGVSTGTQIIQKYLSDDLESVEAVVEFSPVNNEHWESPRILPPLLAFTGENDPLLNHERRVAEIDAHRALGNSIDWIVYDNEGHDLRGRYPIEDRIARTLQFLLGFDTEQSASIDADVAKMPGFDHDPLLLRAQDRSVVSTK